MSEPVFTPEQEARIRELVRDELSKPETMTVIFPTIELKMDDELIAALEKLSFPIFKKGDTPVSEL